MIYVEANHKNYKDMSDMKKHKAQYGKSKKRVADLNKKYKGVSFRLNYFADQL